MEKIPSAFFTHEKCNILIQPMRIAIKLTNHKIQNQNYSGSKSYELRW